MLYTWPNYEDQKQPARKTVAPYWAVCLAVLFGIALAAALRSGRVYAEAQSLIARDGSGNWIRLHDDPCAAAVDWMKLRRAEMFYQGKSYGACWRAEGGAVLVFDDNGDFSMVPVQAFARDVGA